MKIAVVGTGYVGLVTGACLADVGMTVTCVDVNAQKIRNLEQGVLPIYEPGLEAIVERNTKSGRLAFTTSLKDALAGAEAAFIAVATAASLGVGHLVHRHVDGPLTRAARRLWPARSAGAVASATG